MSVQYCEHCHKFIDTDHDVEHWDEGGNCVEFIGYQLTQTEQ